VLIGRLVRDPDMRYTASGTAVTTFTLAVDRPFSNNKGEKEADFIPVVVWRQLAEACANNLTKGRMVAVQGRIQTRNYENTEGRKVYVTEVVADVVRFLERAEKQQPSGGGNGDPFADDGKPIEINDEDLPFD